MSVWLVIRLSISLDWLDSGGVAPWVWLSWFLVLVDVHLDKSFCLWCMHKGIFLGSRQLRSLCNVFGTLRVLVHLLTLFWIQFIISISVSLKYWLVLHVSRNLCRSCFFIRAGCSQLNVFLVALIIYPVLNTSTPLPQDRRNLFLHVERIFMVHIVILLFENLIFAQ